MSKTQNKKLPLIMLPIAMIVAGLITGLISTIVSILTPIIIQELWFSVDPIVYTVVSNVASLIGSFSYIIIIVLFSLVCKGLQKKLCFIMSAYVGSISNILISGVILVTSILLSIIPINDSAIQSLILSGGSAIGGLLGTVVEVLVAIFFFKYLSSFVEKETDEEDEPYKVNLLKPSIVVVGYGVLSLIVGLVTSAISTATNQGALMLKNAYGQIAIAQATSIVTSIILWAVLIGATFLFKDKYQKLTIVGSVIAGKSIWGFVGILFNFITIFFPHISGVVNFFSTGTNTVLGIATGILIFYIANKKQYERIK